MNKWKWFFVFGVISIVVVVLFFLFFSDVVRIDSCLDLGGAWDYTHSVCSSDCESQGINWDPENKVCMFENNEEERLN